MSLTFILLVVWDFSIDFDNRDYSMKALADTAILVRSSVEDGSPSVGEDTLHC